MTTFTAILEDPVKDITRITYVQPVIGSYSFSFLWGKGYVNSKDNTIQFVGAIGTCKDFIVDTYYRPSSSGFRASYWSPEELKDPTVVLYVNPATKNLILKNVKEVLNPWEEKHGFIPSSLHDIDFSKYPTAIHPDTKIENVMVLRYDPLWMENSMTMSLFLSIFRHVVFTGSISFKNGTTSEYSYYNRLCKQIKQAINYILNNPRDFIKELENSTSTGYEVNPDFHGCTGLFYIGQYLNYKYDDPNYWKTISPAIKKNTLLKYMEKLIEGNEKDVKMQSLQQETPKPRTRKKASAEGKLEYEF